MRTVCTATNQDLQKSASALANDSYMFGCALPHEKIKLCIRKTLLTRIWNKVVLPSLSGLHLRCNNKAVCAHRVITQSRGKCTSNQCNLGLPIDHLLNFHLKASRAVTLTLLTYVSKSMGTMWLTGVTGAKWPIPTGVERNN